MSAIKERISQDLKDAIKSGDSFKRDTLRLLNSAFKQVEVDKRITLSDEDVTSILKSAYKQRQDSLEAYTKANRDDLASAESREMEIILCYLPKQLSDEELREAIEKIIDGLGENKNIGAVMSSAKSLAADGRRISTIAKEILTKS